MVDEGFRYSEQTLDGIVGSLQSAAARLDATGGKELTAPDAGASSEIVALALANLLKSSATAAETIAHTAEQVHASNGGYAQVENSNAGIMRRREQGGLSDPANNMPLN